ncbi:hypothetical protein GCM10022198_04000 [Klugiella xanthotipulae]
MRVYLVGLTGGIAAGKSTVARRLEALGAVRIDADQLARDAVAAGSPGLASVVAAFGSDVLREDGSLDRAALGSRVFADSQALSTLNSIVHPEVQRLARDRFARLAKNDPDVIIVYDIPLLVEAGLSYPWDLVVTVEAPADMRQNRLVELRGFSTTDAANRVASQASAEERRAVAHVVIDSSGTTKQTLAQTDSLWERILATVSGT